MNIHIEGMRGDGSTSYPACLFSLGWRQSHGKPFADDAAVCGDEGENPGTILFFRLGDFYEMFFEDAKLVSRELDLTLTGRDCGQGRARAPMCGVPFHSAENYIARLVQKG